MDQPRIGVALNRKSVPITRLKDRQLLTTVEGIFVKVAFATEVGMTLARGLPHRPAARFNWEYMPGGPKSRLSTRREIGLH